MPVSSRILRIVVFALVASVLVGAGSLRAQAPGPLEADLHRMLAAVVAGSYDQFVAGVDPTFKAAMNKEIFGAARKGLEPRLKQGFDTAYLGNLKQQKFVFHLWKIVCKDKGDDFLVRMGTQGGKVVGFTVE